MEIDNLKKKLKHLIKDYEDKYQLTIDKAIIMAENYHAGQTRQSGDPYISHPLNVAIILAEMNADVDTICAGLLHDTLEDTVLSPKKITEEFNAEVTKLVQGVTKISNTIFSSRDEELKANDRKLVLSITEDIRIVIIKLADRLHNMQTLEHKTPEKRKSIAFETLSVFAPLANYIGAYKLKNELEDLSMSYLQPESYKKLKEKYVEIYQNNETKLYGMVNKIKTLLADNGIQSDVSVGLKHIFGIYKRATVDTNIEYIPNIFNITIAVNDLKDCYYAMGLINSIYPPQNEFIEDFIANPKHNTYRSLHTVFKGDNGLLTQAQIRTKDMDLIASYGLTAYWKLNPNNVRERMQRDISERFMFYNSIKEIDQTFTDNTGFLEQIHRELFTKKICIYSQTQSFCFLPEKLTVKDFAYILSPDILSTMKFAVVNDKIITDDIELHDGDIVSIVVNSEEHIISTEYQSFIRKNGPRLTMNNNVN